MHFIRDWWQWLGWKRLIGAGVALPVAVVVVWWFVQLPTPPVENFIPTATTVLDTSSNTSPDTWLTVDDAVDTLAPLRIAVHVVGAVQQPGVYHLVAGARGDDALRAAGGPTPDADVRRVNLAATLVDGEQLIIPRVGERLSPTTAAINPPVRREGPGAPRDNVPTTVNINVATADDLDRLPGIGPSTARAIVDHRTRNGPFATVDDLLAVRGIGPAKLAELRQFVRV